MSTSPSTRTPDASLGTGGFPWGPLLIMALAGFILIATETMPAGLLPQIASGMDITEGAVGLYVSAYALGTVLVTIPAIALVFLFHPQLDNRPRPKLRCSAWPHCLASP